MNSIIYIPADPKKAPKVEKVGKLHKANRLVKLMNKKDAIETAFMNQAFKANRAELQRDERRGKR